MQGAFFMHKFNITVQKAVIVAAFFIFKERKVKRMKIDWKRKLTSRKFWVAVIGFVTPLLLAFGISEGAVTQIAGIITAGATMIAYIIGEGLTDAAAAGTDKGEDA